MGFQTGLSGLNASSKNLDVIGNNVANSSTVGFKTSQAQFADVFAASLAGSGASQVGIGTRLANVSQQFTQGNISVTNNPLDVAINGRGFFRLSDAGAISYTRNGQFQLDKDSYIVTNGGQHLTGYQADSTGSITGALGDLRIDLADQPPTITSTATVGANLDSNSAVITAAWVDPDPSAAAPAPVLDPASYNSSTSMTVYDSLGNSHVVSMYFAKTAANTWDVNMTMDGYGTAVGNPVISGLAFTDQGVIDPATYTPTTISFDLATINPDLGAQSPLDISFDYGETTQFGSVFGVNTLSQNGYASGRMAGFSIGSDGLVQGRYTNGQTKTLGQVALANFANPQGLQPLGDNQWSESPSSGQALVGGPGTASLGLLQSAATEDSNVDLTAELVNMIVAQRAYQANAQTIKTQDAVLQTLVNLR
ncbi:MAG: flagellar hook protein FlgE [Gammaproteobacteria bacterium]|nr:flagellar hook protein FlgE [Gammaproteobacteria bacterium]MBU1730956.1 flagellar hook protein FlgE [Gammaproteobacteria bacterium]MBU1893616.1 flagellar hook protein FlgE [Gammaproteobacteria bacterium]